MDEIISMLKTNKTYNILLKEAVKKTENMLMADEKVLYAVGGNMNIVDNQEALKVDFFNAKGKLAGVLTITNKRVIFCNSVLGAVHSKEIALKDIQSIDNKEVSFLGIGKLRIKGITETFVMDISRKGIIEEIEKTINSNKQEKESRNNISNADEIMKFKKLLDDGIITQEEFKKKKQELLK